jgi:hypothetical protein
MEGEKMLDVQETYLVLEDSTEIRAIGSHSECVDWIIDNSSWDCRPTGGTSDWYDPASGKTFSIYSKGEHERFHGPIDARNHTFESYGSESYGSIVEETTEDTSRFAELAEERARKELSELAELFGWDFDERLIAAETGTKNLRVGVGWKWTFRNPRDVFFVAYLKYPDGERLNGTQHKDPLQAFQEAIEFLEM